MFVNWGLSIPYGIILIHPLCFLSHLMWSCCPLFLSKKSRKNLVHRRGGPKGLKCDPDSGIGERNGNAKGYHVEDPDGFSGHLCIPIVRAGHVFIVCFQSRPFLQTTSGKPMAAVSTHVQLPWRAGNGGIMQNGRIYLNRS